MQINWVQSKEDNLVNTLEILNLEYKFRNQLLLFLIREAEHLVDYIGNIQLNFHLDNFHFALSHDTPEPFRSLVGPQIEIFNEQHLKN